MAKKRVLSVDDSPLVRKLIKKFLSKTDDFEVVGEGSNGEEAVKLFFELRPDIVIIDVTMPVKDGLEAAREILSKDPNANILLASAMGDDDLLEQASAIGIKYSIQKPFKQDQLIDALNKILEG
ncbi:MAG: response regulator [Thermotogaceae bacterium]|nr:response regulator [Thermotogaceae bacterium]